MRSTAVQERNSFEKPIWWGDAGYAGDIREQAMVMPGQIIHIDLSKGICTRSPYPENHLPVASFGRGYNVDYLYHHLPPNADPLGPDNILMVSCGLLTGTGAPASSRVHLSALSPQTGLFGSSNVGGYFGAALRAAGVQSLVISGRAREPALIRVGRDRVEILNAEEFWGQDTWDAETSIRRKMAFPKSSSLIIGPAGERTVRFACVISDREHAAGRTGMGAVMGSKGLKAIVVERPSRFVHVRSAREREVVEQYLRQVKASSQFRTLSDHGGAGYVKWADEMGILAARNYRSNHFEGADRIDGKNLTRYKRRSTGCYRCPVQCKAELLFHDGRYKGMGGFRPEFEPMVALGSKCGLDDVQSIVYLDNLCTRLGLDTISAGGALAFAMDLYERGILSLEDTGGLDFSWGNGKAMESLIVQMARREGFGAVFSNGLPGAARTIGRNAVRFAPHVKGLDLSAYHPSHIMGTALSYAVSTRGGDFNQAYPSIEYVWSPEKAALELGDFRAVNLTSNRGKGQLVKRSTLVNIALDCLGLCKVPSVSLMGTFDLRIESDLVSAFTPFKTDPAALFTMSERIAHLERLFNIRHGATAEDDRLPAMFCHGADPEKTKAHESPDWLKPMVQDFYGAMGWDEQGVPTGRTLEEFGIEALS